jgi:hypothetical protein
MVESAGNIWKVVSHWLYSGRVRISAEVAVTVTTAMRTSIATRVAIVDLIMLGKGKLG